MLNISKSLIQWYSHHKRNLPWRETRNPYLIWVSEIILQQTRVNQGLDYYLRFVDSFPDIYALAKADIDNVLRIWQGLGYYSRARNMHFTANYIVNELNGEFPDSFDELKKLKGIGDYTAAAIASFSFNQPVPVVDGNVYRFLARLLGIFDSTQTSKGKKIFFDAAQNLIDRKKPSDFNQAIMEFGSIVCTPASPDCQTCIFQLNCYALNNNKIDELPAKKPKIKTRTRFFTYIYILYNNNYTFLEKRTENDIWKWLYQFPLIETQKKLSDDEILKHQFLKELLKDTNPKIDHISTEKKHILSHQRIQARFVKIWIENLNSFLSTNYKVISVSEIDNYGLPRLIESYLELVNK